MNKTGEPQDTETGDTAAPIAVLAGLFLDLWQANLKAFALDQQREPDAAAASAPKEGRE